ncbi:MAG: hypothetical protein AAF806_24630 [Bacteroidota bacterium]
MAQRNSPFGGSRKINTGSLIIGAVVMIVIMVTLFSLAKLTYQLLAFVALPLLIITAIIDYKIIVNYVNWVINLTKNNALLGIGTGLLSVVFYPVVAAILFGRAFFSWRLKKSVEQREEAMNAEQGQQQIGEYIDFEEIKKPRQKVKQTRTNTNTNDSDYDQFFD